MKKPTMFSDLAKKAKAEKAASDAVARKGYDTEELGSNADRPQTILGEAALGSRVADASGVPAWQADPAKEAGKKEYAKRQKELLAAIGIRDPKEGSEQDRKWAVAQAHMGLALAARRADPERVERILKGLRALKGYAPSHLLGGLLWPLFGQLAYSLLYGRMYAQQAAIEAEKTRRSKKSNAQVNTWAAEKATELAEERPALLVAVVEVIEAMEAYNGFEALEENPKELDRFYVASQLVSSIASRSTPEGVKLDAIEQKALFEAACKAVDPATWPEMAKAGDSALASVKQALLEGKRKSKDPRKQRVEEAMKK